MTPISVTDTAVMALAGAGQAEALVTDSAPGCSRGLLPLSSGHEPDVEARRLQTDLHTVVSAYGTANDIDLRLERLSLRKFPLHMLPPAWCNQAGDWALGHGSQAAVMANRHRIAQGGHQQWFALAGAMLGWAWQMKD